MRAFPDQTLGDVFRRVTEQFSDTVVAKIDGRGLVRYLNPFGMRLVGLVEAALPDELHWRMCVPEVHHEPVLNAFAQADPRSPEVVFDVPLEFTTPEVASRRAASQAAPRWYRCRALRIDPSAKEPLHWLIRLVDIGHRKLTEERLRIASERLAHAVGASSVLLFAQDVSLRYIWTNRPLIGWTTEQALGSTDLELFCGQDNASLLHEQKRSVLQTGIGWRAEVSLLHGGATYHLDISVSVARNPEGTITGLVGAAFDVTPIREAEQRLRDADRRKDMHLAMMAHELRNPLAPLRAIHELLRTRGEQPSLNQREVALLGRQIKHLTRVVDDLLDLSRLNQASLKLFCRAVDVRTILHDVTSAADMSAPGRALRLELILPDQPLMIHADSARIGQVMGNLLQNAFKFTEAPGQITVRAWSVEQHAKISVTDTGIGIARENLTRIFNPYSQVERPESHAPIGLGLGLHLSREIAQLHGGHLDAISAGLGEGSVFTLTLPHIDGALPPPAIEQSLLPPDSYPKRILVIDDNVDAAQSLTLMLQAWGHEAIAAFDGHEGLQQGALFQPTVVVLDLLMPGISGFDVARAIRNQPWGKHALLVSLSGLNRDIDLQLARTAGFDVNLTKPADPAQIRRLLESRPLQRSEQP